MSDLFVEQIRPELTWRLRREVLYPNKKLYEMEMDEDMGGIHFGGFTDNKLVAVISLFNNDGDYQFRKFAVDAAYQGQGIGSSMLQYVTAFAAQAGGTRLWCNARTTAIDFYLQRGFAHTGNFFSRNGFEYEIVVKPLQ